MVMQNVESQEMLETVRRTVAGFHHVEMGQPGAFHSIATLGDAGLKTAMGQSSIEEPPVNVRKIVYRVVTSGKYPDGWTKLYPTAAEAIDAWKSNFEAVFPSDISVCDLIWRVFPELEFTKDFERDNSGYSVYSRFAIVGRDDLDKDGR